MRRSRKRLLALFAAVPLLIVVSALLYRLGMSLLENRPRSFWDSIEWASETLTTTGYGHDNSWRHPLMVVLVVCVQLVGVFLVYLIFPIYLIPFLEERFETRLPKEVPRDLIDHAVIYRFGAPVETLLDELLRARVPTLVIEEDEAVARRLFDRGQRIVHRTLGDGALESSRLLFARALIANGSDDENAAVILAARQLGFTGMVLGLVEEPYHRRPMMLAGATAVFTPRHILGAALAARASSRISPRVAGIQQLGRNLEVGEVRIPAGSPLIGKTLAEAAIGTRTGTTVIGQWSGTGEMVADSSSDVRIVAGGILVAVGSHESLDHLHELAGDGRARQRPGPFVVAGYGEVGKKVVELLRAVGEEVRVIDRHPSPDLDRTGDVLDARELEALGVASAQAVILALDTDSATLFATVILKDLAPEVPVIARVNRAENVDRIHRAGAYFALSISQVSGQMLAKKLLGEEAFEIDASLKVRKVSGKALSGIHLAPHELRRKTGCSVVAVERGEEVLVDLPDDFRFAPDDAVYVCGSGVALQRFVDRMGGVGGRSRLGG